MSNLSGMPRPKKIQIAVEFRSQLVREEISTAIEAVSDRLEEIGLDGMSQNKFFEYFATWFLRLPPEERVEKARQFRAAFYTWKLEADTKAGGSESSEAAPKVGVIKALGAVVTSGPKRKNK